MRHDAAALGLALYLVAAGPPTGAGTPPRSAPVEFPPLPSPAERAARNEAERRAGAVLLQRTIVLDGDAKLTLGTPKGWSRRDEFSRYLVLDANGVAQLAQLRLDSGEGITLQGRTVTAGGEVFPLVSERDVRTLEVKDGRGNVLSTTRTVIFPNLEPGAVLDLAWTRRTDEFPGLELVPLQTTVPTRTLRVETHGNLFHANRFNAALVAGDEKPSDLYWVPFFQGPVPPRARARINGEYDLELEMVDVPPMSQEPWAPPASRTDYVLGLIPMPFTIAKEAAGLDWQRNLILFGPPGLVAKPEQGGKAIVDRTIDPEQALVQLDSIGLQPLPDWRANSRLLGSYQAMTRGVGRRFEGFFDGRGGEDAAAAAAAAIPDDLPWRERARRLLGYVRRRVPPDPNAPTTKNFDALLKAGRGNPLEVTFVYAHLATRIGLPARVVVPAARFAPPFLPFVTPPQGFGPQLYVEVGPPGDPPLYLLAGDPYASSTTFLSSHLGSLALREPDRPGGTWSLVRLPVDAGGPVTTRMELSTHLAAGATPLPLRVTTTLDGAAAWSFRWKLKWPFPASQAELRSRAVISDWIDQWFGLELTGECSTLDPTAGVDEPLAFTAETEWRPEVHRLDDRFLVPTLPAEVLHNPFTADERHAPIWLSGGHLELSLSWALPAGTKPGPLPEAVEADGPGGLSFTVTTSLGPATAERGGPALTTRVDLDLPYMLPASDYPAAKEFFAALERAGERRVEVTPGN